MIKEETDLRKMGFRLIAGTDEAGRGPLAGPVVAAAVVFPETYRNKAIRNSKELSAMERERLFAEIRNSAISWAVGVVGWRQIDEIGILNASKLAMRQAVLKLDPRPDFILSDAVGLNIMGIPQKAIIKADETVFCVAAASILAKVHRDRLMMFYHKKYPDYGFARHMGYATEVHLSAIKKHGACPIHRLSFSPFSNP
ncbi:ribonuclease HII [Patescibacteria group bacterium]|nr:ribonuclease HII [Patescibacteria group bacterium]MBU1015609.1 ribonuclease HII [Patescibacteria group bacterium]MBU1685016.1 ribonuclease HII [Patescibacteria group bacterium]MBU1938122.1 ribonuclease HII [Patescibacteria group bacterium]